MKTYTLTATTTGTTTTVAIIVDGAQVHTEQYPAVHKTRAGLAGARGQAVARAKAWAAAQGLVQA